jgi:hypothetical protein
VTEAFCWLPDRLGLPHPTFHGLAELEDRLTHPAPVLLTDDAVQPARVPLHLGVQGGECAGAPLLEVDHLSRSTAIGMRSMGTNASFSSPCWRTTSENWS